MSARFQFTYSGRAFDFESETRADAELWVICLKFLNEHSEDVKTQTSKQAQQYFRNLPTFTKIVQDLRVDSETLQYAKEINFDELTKS